ncbi:hypothetical protein EVAR_73206_1 [Eumeta japonica]|uniref:Uncharacterized protein n=1 Tax=Eumeta variegata TaxID=151549 RepID=A0A4C1T719_EUMVA|nr:hypothetical protein EVAR_73206_1 [Eumeta japonica]
MQQWLQQLSGEQINGKCRSHSSCCKQNKDNQPSAASLLVTVKQENLIKLVANCNQQQQHFNQNVTDNSSFNNCQQQQLQQQQYKQNNRFSDASNKSNANVDDNNVAKYSTATRNGNHVKNKDTSLSSPASFQGLSTDATRISKLPLYTYQHKQLQQPQTLYIKLLQQQQATKAIASQITTTSSSLAVLTTSTVADKQQNVMKTSYRQDK